jgi:hypothetical protein
MKNIYNDHMINRMIQIRSSEDQMIIMIFMIFMIYGSSRMISGDRCNKDLKDSRSKDRSL